MHHHGLPEEPSTAWAVLSRCAMVACLLLMFGGLILKYLPRLEDLKAADGQILQLKEKISELEREKARLEQTSILLTQDPKFVEYKARDYLGMMQNREKVFQWVE